MRCCQGLSRKLPSCSSSAELLLKLGDPPSSLLNKLQVFVLAASEWSLVHHRVRTQTAALAERTLRSEVRERRRIGADYPVDSVWRAGSSPGPVRGDRARRGRQEPNGCAHALGWGAETARTQQGPADAERNAARRARARARGIGDSEDNVAGGALER